MKVLRIFLASTVFFLVSCESSEMQFREDLVRMEAEYEAIVRYASDYPCSDPDDWHVYLVKGRYHFNESIPVNIREVDTLELDKLFDEYQRKVLFFQELRGDNGPRVGALPKKATGVKCINGRAELYWEW